jgi:hypothetical protein
MKSRIAMRGSLFAAVAKLTVKQAIVLIGAFLCCLGAGCMSSGSITKSSGGIDRVGNLDTVLLETVSELPRSEDQRRLLHALVASGLQQSGYFGRVSGGGLLEDSGNDFKVTARITALSKVSDGARVAVGALAGQASIVVDVELADLRQDTVIGTFQAVGKSSGGWVGAGTTNQAVQRAADQIVEEIVKRR